jgi:hypothetical protein
MALTQGSTVLFNPGGTPTNLIAIGFVETANGDGTATIVYLGHSGGVVHKDNVVEDTNDPPAVGKAHVVVQV